MQIEKTIKVAKKRQPKSAFIHTNPVSVCNLKIG